MSRKIKRLRRQAFERQGGRCYYCERTIWLGDPEGFIRTACRSHRAARQFQCTAEHLIPRQDGGADTRENIVAACRFCNATRHRKRRPRSAAIHREHVRRRIRQTRWCP